MTTIKTKVIDDKSPYLESVIKLGDANKKTLGFFSRGAFINQASKKLIIVALDDCNNCVGYLMYRIAKKANKVRLAHLCIDPKYRGQKITKKLLEHLKLITKNYYGISLRCRRDYNIDLMWEKLGFVPYYERNAKSKNKLLTDWWYDFEHQNLFSFNYKQTLESTLCIVIDFRVFQDIYLENKALFPDWIEPSLNLCITDEIFTYINNIENKEIRKKLKNHANDIDNVAYNKSRLNYIYNQLKQFCDRYELDLLEYDIRHLAKTIASDIVIFVTCNDNLLRIADTFYDRFRLLIKSTDEIIKQEEDLINDKLEYQPIRLAGSQLEKIKLTSGGERGLEKYFVHDKDETHASFQQRLRSFIIESNKFECYLITKEKNPIALIVYQKDREHELDIPLIRIKDCELASTLAHNLIYSATLHSVKNNKQFTKVTDTYLQDIVIAAIRSDSFFQFKDFYFRANISIIDTKENISKYIANLTNKLGQEYDCFDKYATSLLINDRETNIQSLLTAESFFFPTKITDAEIPTFIIPIKPDWARQLFDENLANQCLFGNANSELSLNIEAVYYKSKYGAKQLKPGVRGRIFWYVSSNKRKNRGFVNVSRIRACSYLEEVIIDKPKDLYNRFRNLGVYELKDVLSVAKNELDEDIMALKFNKTELFKNPISLSKIQKILNNKTTIQSPIFINNEAFSIIYRDSMGTSKLSS